MVERRRTNVEPSHATRLIVAEVIASFDDPNPSRFASAISAFFIHCLVLAESERREAAAQVSEAAASILAGRPLRTIGWVDDPDGPDAA